MSIREKIKLIIFIIVTAVFIILYFIVMIANPWGGVIILSLFISVPVVYYYSIKMDKLQKQKNKKDKLSKV